MIKFIRSILSKLTFGKHTVFEGSGRVDETITGVMAQHYGFASVPPEGVELYTLQFGNNNVSVAENDGKGKTEIARTQGSFGPGTVAVYTPLSDNNNKTLLMLLVPDQTDPSILMACESGTIEAGADTIFLQTDDKVYVHDLSNTPLPTYALVNVNWITQQFATHTHAVGSVTSGAPNPGVTPILPETTTKLESA
jgi:hypothetical protein